MKKIVRIALVLLIVMAGTLHSQNISKATYCREKPMTPKEGQAMLKQRLLETTTREQWIEYTRHIRACMLKGADLEPLPRRIPLNVISRNLREHDGYTVENIAFETVPGYFAGCNLYRPTEIKVSTPVVLCPNGHWGDTRFNAQVQTRCAMLARMGVMAMSIGNFGWGTSPDQVVKRIHVKPLALTMQTWNNMRALDFLLSLERADPRYVGVTGASGGGTQTLLLTALDERVTVSVPVAMVSAGTFGGCLCESSKPIHRSDNHNTNNAEITAMAAPRPLLLISDGGDWTATTPDLEYLFMQKIYALFQAEDKVENAHFPKEGHDYGPNKRKAMYRFMAKHMNLDINRIQNDQGQIDESMVVIEDIPTLQVFNDSNPFPPNVCQNLEDIEAALASLKK